jgi:uncharacterized protein YbjQ (UPF0145 family)
MLGLVEYVLGPAALLLVTFFTGTVIERKHLRSLEERERALRIGVSNLDPEIRLAGPIESCVFVDGQAVIAADRFKVALGTLVSVFGGEIRTLTRVMARARREAIVRMLERAEAIGADHVWNVRIETSNIGRGEEGRRGGTMAEIHAYGTAIRMRRQD